MTQYNILPDPFDIINKYYTPGKLYDLLVAHSRLVRDKALDTVRYAGIQANEELIASGAMLHDLGIFLCDAPSIFCYGSEPYIRHGILGGEILRKEGFPQLARFCERHTGAGLTAEDIRNQKLPLPQEDFLPETIEEKAVCYADKFFSKSGDYMKEKPLEKVIASMAQHGEETLKRFNQLHELFRK